MVRIKFRLYSKLVLTLMVGVILQAKSQQQQYFPDPDPLIQKRLEEWKDLKFGLLMHWGPYSQWGIVESWSICPEDLSWASGGRKKDAPFAYNDYLKEYEKLKTSFNPIQFNPEKWAIAAKDAGMKYMVFTTKHHDGFCMFDSKYTDYKITGKTCPFSTHPRSNITREIFSAFRKENFWIGAYFSKPDWHSDDYWWNKFPPADRNPNYSIVKYPDKWNRFREFTHSQVNELLTDYGRVDILWLDGGWVRKKTEDEITSQLMEQYEGSRWARNPQSQDIDMETLVKNAREKQPEIIVVDRAVPGEHQNYLTPEQHIPEEGLPYPWETCMTMATSWSYVPNDVYKPANELIENLVDIVSKGGNYLLNIGPGPDGELDPSAYNRLKEIGGWMKINGEAIYGTRMYSVFGEGKNIRYTQSKDRSTRYIFMFDYPQKELLLTKMNLSKNSRLEMLGSKEKIKWKKNGEGVQLSLPPLKKGGSDHVWVIKVRN